MDPSELVQTILDLSCITLLIDADEHVTLYISFDNLPETRHESSLRNVATAWSCDMQNAQKSLIVLVDDAKSVALCISSGSMITVSIADLRSFFFECGDEPIEITFCEPLLLLGFMTTVRESLLMCEISKQ